MHSTSTSSSSDRGVVYVAVGMRYLEEAVISARSVRKTNASLPIHLFTDSHPVDASDWDVIVPISADMPGSAMKLHMDRAPWKYCLFIDTDTLIVGSLDPIFTLLERFDFAAMQHGGGHHYSIPGLPPSFPEYNSGVIAWRRSERTSAFFARWRELYAQMREPCGRTWDQKSLRVALYESDLRITSLPHGYNLMPYFPAVIECAAVVLHGRNIENLRRLDSRLAQSTEMRAYVPGVGVLRHPRVMRWSEVLNAIFRMLAWKVRGMFR